MAIRSEELRIGNWLISISSGRQLVVDDIGDSGINIQWYHELTDYEFRWQDVDPIPLTSSILEKCGFNIFSEQYNNGFRFKYMKLYNHNENLYFNPYDWNFQLEIKYLHQLQNLFFALTGEELEYKR